MTLSLRDSTPTARLLLDICSPRLAACPLLRVHCNETVLGAYHANHGSQLASHGVRFVLDRDFLEFEV